MKLEDSPGDIPPGDVLSALVAEPGTGVCVITQAGDLVYLNRACADIFFGHKSRLSRLRGRNLTEVHPANFVADRMSLIAETLGDDTPRLFRAFHRGRQHFSWITPHGDRVLVITRRHGAGAGDDWRHPEGYLRVNSSVAGLGPLGTLSPRELATLALLGDGMADAEIAEHLGVTVRTARWHRTQVGKKLGVHRRHQLVKYVQRIGFTIRDAESAAG